MKTTVIAALRGKHFNTGNGRTLQPVDIQHRDYVGLVDPDTAFWSLVRKDRLGDVLTTGTLLRKYHEKAGTFAKEMEYLRFGLKPSAVYFNPTERCNLNCPYCYIPETMRAQGVHMTKEKLVEALAILQKYFRRTVPRGLKPQVVFHGSEPLLNKDAVFAGIEKFGGYFNFGVQTNGTLLDDAGIEFLKSRRVAIGLSLDAGAETVATRTRKTWAGGSVYKKVVSVVEKLRGYPNFSVICTVTQENMRHLIQTVDFFHGLGVPTCMLNPVRCTREGARKIKPLDYEMSRYYLAALDRTQHCRNRRRQ